MIKGDYDRLKDIAASNNCARCGGDLEVAWSNTEDSYVLGCGEHGHIGVVIRKKSATEEWRAGAPSPEEYLDQELGKERRGKLTQEKQTLPITLGAQSYTDLSTGEQLTPAQARGLIDYAEKYHLDPYRGHVVMMHGKPYIGIDGYLYHAKKTERSYTLETRPMTTEEESQYKVDKSGHNWLSRVSFIDTDATFVGIGIVTLEEMTAKSTKKPDQLRSPVVAAHPWQLAQKRAEWQALRRAFPIGETE